MFVNTEFRFWLFSLSLNCFFFVDIIERKSTKRLHVKSDRYLKECPCNVFWATRLVLITLI